MFVRALMIAIVSLAVAGGCEKTNHDSIDKWMQTSKGPGKLEKTLVDESLDPELSAHAAANLIRIGMDPQVRTALEKMSQPRRVQVISKLAPRLWDLARIDREDALPGSGQIVAKDALITLRKYADDAQKLQIDGYLVDWYGVMSYEARAKVGATLGAQVMRMVGPAGGKKLISVLNGVIAAPGQETTKIRIGDELMLGMAASGHPDAVKYLLDVARMDRGDVTLPRRALRALHRAYVDPGGEVDLADPAALVANLDALVAIARDETLAGQAANDAVELIRAAGAPHCLDALTSMVPLAHPDPRFRYTIVYAALLCGGPDGIERIVGAMPDSGTYVGVELQGAVSGPIAKMSPPDKVKAALRELLGSGTKVGKWVAIEALAAMTSVEDAPRIAALAKSKDRLTGYWGDQSGVAAKERKADPTLGQRAKELSDQLAGTSTK